MINRSDDVTYQLAAGLSMSGPPVSIEGGVYTLFIDSTSNNGTLSLQMRNAAGVWADCQTWGLQYVRTAEYTACLLGLELCAGVYRLCAQGLVLNLNAYLVGNG